MRLLMMISNNNIAVREIYGMALRERYPTWSVSHMSGLPPDAGPIVTSYDALIYEIGAESDPRRYKPALALWDDIKGSGATRMITHIEGAFSEGIVAELEGQGIICVAAPFTPENAGAALARIAPAPAPRKGKEAKGAKERPTPAEGAQAGESGGRGRGLFRGLFRRRE